ncbi:hypothetical protein HMPREF3293_01735 [Christensenella minuta]|uniref:Uncharacterized protein n=1 Tax=Christensenella minuta TaxID=626937 RepID=A0A136Q4C5_9FIRM|nr:hypothetical protein HMPREF3293_01735 [Christensenella minuta]
MFIFARFYNNPLFNWIYLPFLNFLSAEFLIFLCVFTSFFNYFFEV